MADRYAGQRPPDGHPDLNPWLTKVSSYHEAAHAVGAYFCRYPCLYVELQPITHDRIDDNAHLAQDIEAINIAFRSLDRSGLPSGKGILMQCVSLEIARAVNMVFNGVPFEQAMLNAQSDVSHTEETFRLNNLSRNHVDQFNESSKLECERLLRNKHFGVSVDTVASLLVSHRILTDWDVAQAVERVTPLRFRLRDGDPDSSDVQSEAFYLSTRRSSHYSPLENWLSAERGLRFARHVEQ